MGDLFFLETELNVLSRKRLAPCISHIKPCAVGTSSGVKYVRQLHRNMQMWAYTAEGKEGGRWWWFISRVLRLVLVDVNCSLSIFHLNPSFLQFSPLIFFFFLQLCYSLLILSVDTTPQISFFIMNIRSQIRELMRAQSVIDDWFPKLTLQVTNKHNSLQFKSAKGRYKMKLNKRKPKKLFSTVAAQSN